MTSEDDVCARCGGPFHCGMKDAQPCACTTVRLSAATLAQLRERYVGCLCMACLRALQDEDAAARVQPGAG